MKYPGNEYIAYYTSNASFNITLQGPLYYYYKWMNVLTGVWSSASLFLHGSGAKSFDPTDAPGSDAEWALFIYVDAPPVGGGAIIGFSPGGTGALGFGSGGELGL
jgi:hypothetical protein